MPTYAVVIIGLGCVVFAACGAFAIVRPRPIARFVEAYGKTPRIGLRITLRIGAPVAPTADNVRLIGIAWVVVGVLLGVLAFTFVATH